MTIKSTTADGDEVVTETMSDRLRAVQMESWQRMEYVDEDTEDAWAAYQECLFLRPAAGDEASNAAPPSSAAPVYKGKGKETAAAAVADAGGAADLNGRVPRLETDWGEDELLRAVSGINAHDKKPGEEAVTESAEPVVKEERRGNLATPTGGASATDPKKRPGRPSRTPAPAGAPKRGGRSANSAPRTRGAA